MRSLSVVGVVVSSMVSLAPALVIVGWSADARADSTTDTPSTATIYPSVNGNLQVVGARTVSVGVNHSDGGWNCTKITEVDVIDKSSNLVVGTAKPPRPLCNFNSNDVTVTVTPFTDSTLINACSGNVGQTVTQTAYLDTCLTPSAGSFSIGAVFGGQQDQCGKASVSVTAIITCPPAPAPPASTSGQSSTSSTGNTSTPVVVVGGVLVPGTFTVVAPTTTKGPTRIVPGASFAPGKFIPGKQTIALDPSLLPTAAVGPQSQKNSATAADYSALSAAYANYAGAQLLLQAKYEACMNQTYTPAQQIAACTATDTTVVCAQKLVNQCDAAEQRTYTTTRAAVNAAATKLATDAQALANETTPTN